MILTLKLIFAQAAANIFSHRGDSKNRNVGRMSHDALRLISEDARDAGGRQIFYVSFQSLPQLWLNRECANLNRDSSVRITPCASWEILIFMWNGSWMLSNEGNKPGKGSHGFIKIAGWVCKKMTQRRWVRLKEPQGTFRIASARTPFMATVCLSLMRFYQPVLTEMGAVMPRDCLSLPYYWDILSFHTLV